MSKEYFCWQASKEEFDYKGKSLGMSDELAIYYNRSIGRRRNYRQTYPISMYKGLVLKTFKSQKTHKNFAIIQIKNLVIILLF